MTGLINATIKLFIHSSTITLVCVVFRAVADTGGGKGEVAPGGAFGRVALWLSIYIHFKYRPIKYYTIAVTKCDIPETELINGPTPLLPCFMST